MKRVIAVVAAGAGIVALIAVWQGGAGSRSSREATDAAAVSEEARAGRLGVQGADVDSARRVASGDPSQRKGFPGQGRGGREPRTEGIEPEPWSLPRVSPPILPNSADVVESEAVLAARPAVQEAVDDALERARAQVRRDCWTGDMPESASFPVEVTYSAEGTMVGLSVGDVVAAPGVSACVVGQAGLVPATIEAPGVGVTVKVSLDLP
jgi:hypothetical protein